MMPPLGYAPMQPDLEFACDHCQARVTVTIPDLSRMYTVGELFDLLHAEHGWTSQRVQGVRVPRCPACGQPTATGGPGTPTFQAGETVVLVCRDGWWRTVPIRHRAHVLHAAGQLTGDRTADFTLTGETWSRIGAQALRVARSSQSFQGASGWNRPGSGAPQPRTRPAPWSVQAAPDAQLTLIASQLDADTVAVDVGQTAPDHLPVPRLVRLLVAEILRLRHDAEGQEDRPPSPIDFSKVL